MTFLRLRTCSAFIVRDGVSLLVDNKSTTQDSRSANNKDDRPGNNAGGLTSTESNVRREFRRFDIESCDEEGATSLGTSVDTVKGTTFEGVGFSALAGTTVDLLNVNRDFVDEAVLIASICPSSSFNC
jgi:hypothetical protein